MPSSTHTTPRHTGPHVKDQDRPASPAQGHTRSKVDGKVTPRLPHERDESSDSQHSAPREHMKQASKDLEAGLVDTDKGPPLDRTYKQLGPNSSK